MTKFSITLERGLEELEIGLSQYQKEQCYLFFRVLQKWNERINLTAIKEEEEAAIKHFIDSFAAGRFIDWDKKGRLLDLGAGGGFPGIVFKIWQPERSITLVDAVQKKIRFLNLLSQELGLLGIKALHIRAEDLGRDSNHRGSYPIVVARAVASLATLSEYCLPLVADGGYFYAFKGSNYEEELQEARAAISVLGGRLESVREYALPLVGDQRSLIVIKKIKVTPNVYPRKCGLPRKKPIMSFDKPD